MKLFGAVLAVVVAALTAIVTPQIIRLETEVARRDKRDAERERNAALADAEKASQDLGVLVAKRDQAEQQRKAAEDDLARLRAAISTLEPSSETSVAQVKATAASRRTNIPDQPFLYVVPSTPSLNSKGKAIASEFERRGYRTYVRSAQRPQLRAPADSEVRYFRSEDRKEALDIGALLADLGFKGAQAVQVSDPNITQTRYFEVRFARERGDAISTVN